MRLTRKRIVVLLNRAIVLGEVEVGTFRLDESDLLAVQGFRGRGDGMSPLLSPLSSHALCSASCFGRALVRREGGASDERGRDS